MTDTVKSSVDTVLPLPQLLLFGLQHVLVMAAVPITSVFLVAKALDLPIDLTVNLISATFLMCGLGSLLQSFGPAKLGAKLPFIMVPGGAPIVMFLGIAQARDLQTACGAVILTSLFDFLILPIFTRVLRFFPKIVIGTLLLLVSINLLKVYGGIIAGKPGTPDFASPMNIGLGLATIGFTLLFARIFKGTLGQLAVLLGLVAGTLLAAMLGQMNMACVAVLCSMSPWKPMARQQALKPHGKRPIGKLAAWHCRAVWATPPPQGLSPCSLRPTWLRPWQWLPRGYTTR